MTASCAAAVSVHTATGGSFTLVLVANRSAGSVSLACRGRGFASFASREAGLLLRTVTTERPSATTTFNVIDRARQTGQLRVTVLGPRAIMQVAVGNLVLQRFIVPDRATLATATARVVDHLAEARSA
ncbi:hypothetical protein [Actinoalloteichus hymeniacidonis]|uniref:Uncharacterized protein n=1 Tax=Actinoalloteichus hymeniacidonis TaxID=340345 RepID=A0AAC9MVY4_9PSEU|nr:hypothetical protein [Actinoalloteichus hymeniacidonis]AOS61618.1 hypothetical protein TL08_03940 [Actinoalloteichus hymeniacidonis]MBB5910371.1 hypothetical protein [Actinoalloteichus hymeniacidonis]